MKENIQTTRFENGLTILTDKMPDVRSVTLGFFFRRGARHEPAELNGISHFIEHTVFKGTTKRTALEIAIETDRLGGNLDAFTMHEETGFAIKVVDKELPNAFDLLADLLVNPVFDEKELKREQKVIIEEIKMTEDAPEELLGELFNEKLFPENALGLSIAGTPKTVRSFNAEITRKFHREIINPKNIIIAAAGNLEHNKIVDLAEKFFDYKTKNQKPKTKNQKPNIAAPIIIKKNKNLEQAHLLIATPFVDARNEKRYAADLLANIFGRRNFVASVAKSARGKRFGLQRRRGRGDVSRLRRVFDLRRNFAETDGRSFGYFHQRIRRSRAKRRDKQRIGIDERTNDCFDSARFGRFRNPRRNACPSRNDSRQTDFACRNHRKNRSRYN